MRKILTIALIVLLAACGRRDNVRITGEFVGLRQADIYVYSLDGSIATLDTIHLVENACDWKMPLAESTTLYLVFPNYSEYVVFAHPGDHIKIKGNATNLRALSIKGNKENEAFTAFRLSHLEDADSARIAAMEAYVEQHTTGLITNYLRRQIALNKGSMSGIALGDTLSAMVLPMDSDSICLGKRASAKKLKHTKGQHPAVEGNTLLVFWASWKRDSRDAMRDIRRLSDSIHVVGISLDSDPNTYAYTCRTDSMDFPNYCDFHIWGTPIVKELQIHELPYYILCDSAWVIRAQGRDWRRDIAPSIEVNGQLLREQGDNG